VHKHKVTHCRTRLLRLYEVSRPVGGFGRHIDSRFLEKFSKVKFGIKFSAFLVSINVVSVSFHPESTFAMAREGEQTAIGDSAGAPPPAKAILYG